MLANLGMSSCRLGLLAIVGRRLLLWKCWEGRELTPLVEVDGVDFVGYLLLLRMRLMMTTLL